MKTVKDLLSRVSDYENCKLKILTEQGEEIELLDLPIAYDGINQEITLICCKK